eukprot:scaffold374_cov124-Cylindrotheca_fusiformis.AAC.10
MCPIGLFSKNVALAALNSSCGSVSVGYTVFTIVRICVFPHLSQLDTIYLCPSFAKQSSSCPSPKPGWIQDGYAGARNGLTAASLKARLGAIRETKR